MKTTQTMTVTVGTDLADRLESIARDYGHSLDDCLIEALKEYVDSREDFARSVAALEEPEERVFLRVISG